MPRDPSYTSGNETSGGAAGEILAFFFPQDAAMIRAEAAGGGVSRLYDGTHWRFDVEAGLAIGRQMGPLFIEELCATAPIRRDEKFTSPARS